ncbi:MAG: hypothetical protein ACLTXL_04875 [Clostridia bacterium]
MLDVSIQAHIMTLLRDLRGRLGLTTCLFPTMDVLTWFCDEIAVMSKARL